MVCWGSQTSERQELQEGGVQEQGWGEQEGAVARVKGVWVSKPDLGGDSLAHPPPCLSRTNTGLTKLCLRVT